MKTLLKVLVLVFVVLAAIGIFGSLYKRNRDNSSSSNAEKTMFDKPSIKTNEPWVGKNLSSVYGEGDYHGDGANIHELKQIGLGMTPDQVRYVLNDAPTWGYLDTTTFESLGYSSNARNTLSISVNKPERLDPKYYGDGLYLFLVFSPEATRKEVTDVQGETNKYNEEGCRLVKMRFMTMKELVAANKAARERKKAAANP